MDFICLISVKFPTCLQTLDLEISLIPVIIEQIVQCIRRKKTTCDLTHMVGSLKREFYLSACFCTPSSLCHKDTCVLCGHSCGVEYHLLKHSSLTIVGPGVVLRRQHRSSDTSTLLP